MNRSLGGINSDPLIYDYRINIISRAEHKNAAQQQMRLHYQHIDSSPWNFGPGPNPWNFEKPTRLVKPIWESTRLLKPALPNNLPLVPMGFGTLFDFLGS